MDTERMDGNISRLVGKYLTETASEAEQAELFSWLEESEDHRRQFAEMTALCSAVRTLNDPELKIKQQRMLMRLNSRIDAQEERPGRHFHWTRIVGIAAAVVLIAGLAFFFMNRETPLPVQVPPQILSYINTSDQVSLVRLEDGTEVLLGAESRLDWHIEENGSETRRIARLTGDAYFDVERDTLRPFIVDADDILVRVLGTRFLVESRQDTPETQIMLEQGSVRLQTPEGVNLVRLKENQTAVYDRATEDLDIQTEAVSSYILENYKQVSFSGICLEKLIRELEKIYGVVLTTDDSIDLVNTYEINFSRTNSLAEVLDIIKALTGVTLEVRE